MTDTEGVFREWPKGDHIMKDIAGTIVASFTSGNFEILRSIPAKMYPEFGQWLEKSLRQ